MDGRREGGAGVCGGSAAGGRIWTGLLVIFCGGAKGHIKQLDSEHLRADIIRPPPLPTKT